MPIVEGPQCQLAMRQISPALLCESQLTRRALEQAGVQARLELDEPCAGGRRREPQLASRSGEASEVRRFDKKPDIAQVVHDGSGALGGASKEKAIIKSGCRSQNRLTHPTDARDSS